MTLIAESRAALAARPTSELLRHLPLTALGLDLLVMVLAGSVAAAGRDVLFQADPGDSVAHAMTVAGPFTIGTWLTSTVLVGGYARDLFGAGTDEYRRVANAAVLTAASISIACFLLDLPMSRGYFFLVFVVGVPALLGGRFALRRLLYRARRRGTLLQRVVIAGSPPHVDEVARVLRRESWLGYTVVGAVIPDAQEITTPWVGSRCSGRATGSSRRCVPPRPT